MSSLSQELKKVLVVDDDDDYNFLTEDTFRDTDLDCELVFKLMAQDGLDYLEANRDHFPDLILLDINMPIMNGWEFLEAYKERGYHLDYPAMIVMISSSLYQEDKDKAKTYPKVVEYIEKPVTTENIHRIMDLHFNQ